MACFTEAVLRSLLPVSWYTAHRAQATPLLVFEALDEDAVHRNLGHNQPGLTRNAGRRSDGPHIYVLTIFGILKIPAAIALLLHGLRGLKEWRTRGSFSN